MGIASLDDRASTIQGELAGPSTATKNSRSTLDSELLVADASCPHIRALLVGCEAPVLWLQGDQHPFLAISQALAERTLKGSASIQTLHWLSHGSPGQLHIGDCSITTAALISHAQQLDNWGIKDLAIWSCSVGSDVTFISVLEELTGATVWASDQPLGRLDDGSSHWQLTNALQIKAPSLPINASRQLAWNHQLAAPTLDSSVSPLLTAIDANTGAPSGAVGTLVSALIDSGGSLDNFADADGGSPAIAITGTNLAGGTLYYSTDNGSNWSDVGTVSDTSARVLYADSNTRLAFKPATDYIGTISDLITFKAWDRSGSIANGSGAIATATSLIGTYDTSDSARGVTLSADGNTAFVADYDDGMQIIDISNPASPTLTGNFSRFDYYDVVLSADGNTAYVASATAQGLAIDVSDPTNPTLLGYIGGDGTATGVALSADGDIKVFADNSNGLLISGASSTTTLATSGTALDVTLSADGNTAFVADGSSGLQIIDISNPASPTLTATLDTSGIARGVTLSADGNTAFVANRKSGLQIIDVSDPANPTLTATFDTSGRAFSVALSADGNTAFVADRNSGLQIVDVSDPANPTLTDTIDTSGSAYDVTLSADGNTAFVADGEDGLQIIAISNTQSFSSNSDIANIQIAVPAPTLTSATYDASSASLVVTGTNLVVNSGALNDIDISQLSITGEGNSSYTFTTSDIEIDSATQFTLSLNAADSLQLAGLLNKNGTTSGGGTTYNLAAASSWNPGASSSPADSSGNAITVSNIIDTDTDIDTISPSLKAAFTAKKVSKVKEFDADASYSVESTDGGSFAIASNKKELKQLMKSHADVVYDEKKGKLYLNDNGTAKGWGAKKVGGLIASFKGKPELSADHFDGLSAHQGDAITGGGANKGGGKGNKPGKDGDDITGGGANKGGGKGNKPGKDGDDITGGGANKGGGKGNKPGKDGDDITGGGANKGGGKGNKPGKDGDDITGGGANKGGGKGNKPGKDGDDITGGGANKGGGKGNKPGKDGDDITGGGANKGGGKGNKPGKDGDDITGGGANKGGGKGNKPGKDGDDITGGGANKGGGKGNKPGKDGDDITGGGANKGGGKGNKPGKDGDDITGGGAGPDVNNQSGGGEKPAGGAGPDVNNQPGGGEKPAGGAGPDVNNQPGGGEKPAGGAGPDVNNQPGGGEKPAGGAGPDVNNQPGGGEKPAGGAGPDVNNQPGGSGPRLRMIEAESQQIEPCWLFGQQNSACDLFNDNNNPFLLANDLFSTNSDLT